MKSEGSNGRTLAEYAVRQIEDSILRGEFSPGERLLLDDLAQDLDMSPMPVREALRRLATLGFVDNQAHKGARVREISADDLLDLYRVRLPLEVAAIRLAAQRFTDEDSVKAERQLKGYAEGYERGDPIHARETHLQYHFTLYAASGSEWLLHAIRPLCQYGERYRLAFIDKRGSVRGREEEHRRLLDACNAHDPERAGRELTRHLMLTVQLTLPELTGASSSEVEAMTKDFLASLSSTSLNAEDTAAVELVKAPG